MSVFHVITIGSKKGESNFHFGNCACPRSNYFLSFHIYFIYTARSSYLKRQITKLEKELFEDKMERNVFKELFPRKMALAKL